MARKIQLPVDPSYPLDLRYGGDRHFGLEQMLAAATAYVEAGISVIPLRVGDVMLPEFSLIPWTPVAPLTLRRDCRQYCRRVPKATEIESWFTSSKSGRGIAVITGEVSGNLEAIKFNFASPFEFWQRKLKARYAKLLLRLTWVRTPGNRFCAFYRCSHSSASETLAWLEADYHDFFPKIELVAEGGYLPVPPTLFSNDSPTHRARYLTYLDLSMVEMISDKERSLLLDLARRFNEATGPDDDPRTKPEVTNEEFERRVGWHEILEPQSWVRLGIDPSGQEYWENREVQRILLIDRRGAFMSLLGSPEVNRRLDQSFAKYAAYTEIHPDGRRQAASQFMLRDFPQLGGGTNITD